MNKKLKTKYPAESVAVCMLNALVRCRREARKQPRKNKNILRHLEILDALQVEEGRYGR